MTSYISDESTFSELSGDIAKRLPHTKNQHSVSDSFFNQFVTDISSKNVESSN